MRYTGFRRRWSAYFTVVMVFTLLMAALALAPPEGVARAATDVVTTCQDDGSAGSFQKVILGAAAGDTITFAQNCTGANAIVLSGTINLFKNVTIDATASNPPHAVTINGNGVAAGFYPNGNFTIGLTGLTLTNFNTAIYNPGSTVFNITACTFVGNAANNGSSVAVSNGTLNITGSAFYNNTGFGAAIDNGGGVNITGSTFFGNSATGNPGGAILNQSGAVTITNGTFVGNSAGGLTNGGGGALYNVGPGARLTITGSTFTGNSAGGTNASGGATAFTLAFSIVAGNTATGSGPDIAGPVTTDNFGNVLGIADGSSGITNGVNHDQAGTAAAPLNPLLAPLGSYGGPVQTVALLPGSVAIDIALCPLDPLTGGLLNVDARGVSRPQGLGCAAGSFESRRFSAINLTGNGQTTPTGAAFRSPVGLTVTSATGEPVVGGFVTFTITPGSGGASAAFGSNPNCIVTSSTQAVCAIGAGGVATSPTFTANGTGGSFTIYAGGGGIPSPSSFTETNVAPAPLAATHPAAATAVGGPPAPRPASHPVVPTPSGATPLPQPGRH